jgi:hypothetical protein
LIIKKLVKTNTEYLLRYGGLPVDINSNPKEVFSFGDRLQFKPSFRVIIFGPSEVLALPVLRCRWAAWQT